MRMRRAGIDADAAMEWLRQIEVMPVFTAHPTEVARRTVLFMRRRIATAVSGTTITAFGARIGYQHWWMPGLRSTVDYSMRHADISTFYVPASGRNSNNKELNLAHANLVWSPVAFVDLGIEGAWGHRVTVIAGSYLETRRFEGTFGRYPASFWVRMRNFEGPAENQKLVFLRSSSSYPVASTASESCELK